MRDDAQGKSGDAQRNDERESVKHDQAASFSSKGCEGLPCRAGATADRIGPQRATGSATTAGEAKGTGSRG